MTYPPIEQDRAVLRRRTIAWAELSVERRRGLATENVLRDWGNGLRVVTWLGHRVRIPTGRRRTDYSPTDLEVAVSAVIVAAALVIFGIWFAFASGLLPPLGKP